MTFFSELRRRNVLRAGLAWLALSWLLIAIADLLFPYLGLPEEAIRGLILGLAIALLPVLVLAWLLELTPRGLRRDRGPLGDNPENARTARRIDQLTIVLILTALAVSGIREFVLPEAFEPPEMVEATQREEMPSPTSPSTPFPAPPGPVDPRSIAVLPFANMSPDPENAFLAEGMAEEILNVLARVEGLRVASRTSAFALQDASLGAREIGRRLGVAQVLDGSVRRQGDQVRVSAQLIRARDDRQLWSGTFDREIEDIFELQEDIAQSITDALAEPLGVRTVRVRRATDDLQAYELFLRGRQLFAQRGASLMPARELLREAVARDEAFAEAWAILAGIEYVMPSYFGEVPVLESRARALNAALTALSLVENEPNALAVRSRLAADRGDRVEAVALAERSLAEDSNSANTWMWQGLTFLEAGHVAAARERFERAQSLDPLSGIHFGWLGATELIEGDLSSAEIHLKRAHALGWQGPASAWLLKLALVRDGYGEQAAERFAQWLADDGRISKPALDVYEAMTPALADHGQRKDAFALMDAARENHPEIDWTQGLLFLGDADRALAEAQRPKPPSGHLVLMMIWSPSDQAAREHPAFLDYAEQNGLVRFWDQFGWPDACRPVGQPPERLECTR